MNWILDKEFIFVNAKWTDFASLLLSPLIWKMEIIVLPACLVPP